MQTKSCESCKMRYVLHKICKLLVENLVHELLVRNLSREVIFILGIWGVLWKKVSLKLLQNS